MGSDDGGGARPRPGPHEPRGGGPHRPAGRTGSPGCRQAAETGAQRRRRPGPLSGILRRRGGQAARGDPAVPGRLHCLYAARAARGDGAYHPVELSDADHRPLGRGGPVRRQRRRAEARRAGVTDRPGLRPCRRRLRPAGGRPECRDRHRGRGGRGPGRPSRDRPPVLHRLDRGGRGDPAGGGGQRRSGDAGAGRQVAPAGVRRRRPGQGPSLPGQRRNPERGPDLFGRIARPGPARRL